LTAFYDFTRKIFFDDLISLNTRSNAIILQEIIKNLGIALSCHYNINILPNGHYQGLEIKK
jgi:hypothetical protein